MPTRIRSSTAASNRTAVAVLNPASRKAPRLDGFAVGRAKLRRECLPSGDGSLCAWLFKGNTVVQSVRTERLLRRLTRSAIRWSCRGRCAVPTSPPCRRQTANPVQRRSERLGQVQVCRRHHVRLHNIFTRQLALNSPLTDVTSVTFTLSSSAATGARSHRRPPCGLLLRFPRGENVLPPPAAPADLRGMN